MDPAQASLYDWMLLVGRTQLPLLIVCLCGIGVGLAKWRRRPRASRLVTLAFGMLTLQSLATIMRLALEVRGRIDARIAAATYVEQYAEWVLPIALLGVAGVLILVRAIFIDRHTIDRSRAGTNRAA